MNHDLEDKMLSLVQENDREQQATMSIHEDLHRKLKHSEQRIHDIIQEKVTLTYCFRPPLLVSTEHVCFTKAAVLLLL